MCLWLFLRFGLIFGSTTHKVGHGRLIKQVLNACVFFNVIFEKVKVGIEHLNATVYDALAFVSCPLHEIIVSQMYQHFVGMLSLAMEESNSISRDWDFHFLTRVFPHFKHFLAKFLIFFDLSFLLKATGFKELNRLSKQIFTV